jgi:FkbM family methyltransferase
MVKFLVPFILSKRKRFKHKRRLFYSQFLSKGDLYFDVGANYGNRIEPVIDLGINIIAVEPQQECIDSLQKQFGNRITIVPMGLGEREEEKTMYISDANTISTFSEEWISSTQQSGRFSHHNWNEQRRIKMTTLDNLISRYGVPRFIKIDVEGFETEVLKGLSTPVEIISFEYAVPEQTGRAIECLQRINDISGGKILCNYSVGESMKWALKKWLSADEMLAEIKSERFTKSDFGDIYIKSGKD